MGRRGPPPKPTALRILNGNAANRPLNEDEPQPAKDMPRCPSWLTAEAKKVWARVAPELARMRVLTIADADALAAYCQVYARWRAAEEFIAKHGDAYPIRDEQGRVKCMAQFPQVSIAKSLLQLVRAYQQEFGMTPSSRTQVRTSDAPKKSRVQQLRDRTRA